MGIFVKDMKNNGKARPTLKFTERYICWNNTIFYLVAITKKK